MNEFIKFEERLIGDGYKYTIGVSAVDLTRTGSLDLVSTDTDVGLYWYENDGNGNFTKHVVHERSNEWLERHATATRHRDAPRAKPGTWGGAAALCPLRLLPSDTASGANLPVYLHPC